MPRALAALLALAAIAPAIPAQEPGYNEDRVAPSRVPPAFRKAAEKEAPGARLAAVYRDGEKGYRFVGKTSDGRTVSVRVDREGKVEFRRTYADVAPAKLPRPVAVALREAIARSKDLEGFQPERTSLVERFDARKNETRTYYEAFGHTPSNTHPRIEIDASGKVLDVDTGFVPSPESRTRRQELTSKEVPPPVLRGITAAAPGIKIAHLYRVTNTITPDVQYEAYGRADRGRAVEVTTNGEGHAYVLAVTVPLREIPRAVIDAVARRAITDKQLAGFRPTEVRIRRLLDINGVRYQLFGDDPEGEPLDVSVDESGNVLTMRDVGLPIREEAGIASAAALPRDALAAKGFSVLAARYGVDHNWIDVTEALREAAEGGRKEFLGNVLPDPAGPRHKTLVMLYAVDGKVGLSEARDDEALPLDARQDPSTLAAVPPRGFAVLAARFGYEEKWEDATEAVRALVAKGRLDFLPADAKLPDPAPGEPKSLAVAYSQDGKAGLYVQSQRRTPNLPPDAPPVNSGALLARSIEFPRAASIVAFTPDGRQAVVGVEDGSIRVIDVATGREARRLDGDEPGWHPVAVSGTGAQLASGSVDGAIRIWDAKTGRESAVLRGHTEKVRRLAFSPNGRQLASTAWDNTVRLWEVPSGREVRRLEGASELVDGLKFTPDGIRLATAGWDRILRIWDVSSGRVVAKLDTGGDALGDLAISKSGREVLFGAKDGTLRRWEFGGDKPPLVVSTGTEAEVACAALPHGRRVFIGDKVAVVLWDVQTGHPVLRLEGHLARVTGLAVSNDGRRVASCGEDKTLKLWNLPDLGR